ncbi:reverse transcriptase domain-containing protein [Mesorhizobium sp. M00.F.Ca.ET.216.01.1.1]|uniref:reverse transcriptase domain-containing protein n=1 Tax=Mesorhizobium sp. M00.F.Ca.ET.216.01.1.1 TaxID=2500528 RepID=UPI0024793090|nr:reverse transcriptase domain-containing protein [Mesorhizobium sp. M00.F.Ca.ET.216.01.1.1]
MEAIVDRDNLRKALAQVRRNKGAPGIDGMSVEALALHLKDHWPELRAQLLEGSYKPQPVRRVAIPKASGGTRPLGIPTVLDRFIQQAVMQVLQEAWDDGFSASSYGFRPARSAHQAVAAAQAFIASGHRVVVDIDLEKFFDRVNHDILMGWWPSGCPIRASFG